MITTLNRVKRIAIVICLLVIAISVVSYWSRISFLFDPLWGLLEPVTSRLEKITEVTDTVDEYFSEYTGDAKDGDARTVIIHTDSATYQVDAELALTTESRARGLMYRTELCEDCGMLFVYDSDVRDGFWMKNCEIPLDMLFVSAGGAILDIKENFPPCEKDPCTSYQPKEDYRYVLEVNGGWCDDHAIKIGDVIDVPSISLSGSE